MTARAYRPFKRNQQLEIRIDDMAFGGKGIAKVTTEKGEFAVFVQNAIPGQLVRAGVIKCKARYAECRMEEVLERSPDEIDIPYQEIPGAPYARLPMEDQAKYKRQTAVELYKRIGDQQDIESLIEGYIKSPEDWHYRNKMEYSFSEIRFDLDLKEEQDDFGLGFKHRGTWWAVENLDKDSGLFDAEFENKLKSIREWLQATGLPAWHPPKKKGFFRYLVVRKSYASNQLLINFVTSSEGLDSFDMEGFLNMLKESLGERLAGVLHTINDQTGDRVDPHAGKMKLIWGSHTIVERVNGLDFEISMASFFQTNPKCAERLYDKVVEYAGSDQPEDSVIMDLFCGTGTIGQLLARQSGREVIGVDIVGTAIKDAKANAKRNSVENVSFFASDVGKFLLEFPQYAGKIHTLVLDPPRAGIAPKTLRKVMRLEARRMVYVSCNPATQARDLETLREAGYQLKKLTLVDQFPHTSHVEAVALIEKT